MKFLDDGMISGLLPAETASFPSPVPTQIVSSDEYLPLPQTEQQKEVEARLIEMSDRLANRQGLSRRRFFQTAAGMAASFVAMNEVFGRYFIASEAEAATPELADQLAAANTGQFIFDGHTHCATTRGWPASSRAGRQSASGAGTRSYRARNRLSTTSSSAITSKKFTWTAIPRLRS
jgi:hypothetical protein